MDVAAMGVLIPLVAVSGIILIVILRILVGALRIIKGDAGGTSGAGQPDETRLIQDIYHGLLKMEERVEALETLLLERERKGDVQ
ncbi:MAG: hypothetical protein AMXMBFR4_19310 [Candidatus Hydrogenedentota bacterium]